MKLNFVSPIFLVSKSQTFKIPLFCKCHHIVKRSDEGCAARRRSGPSSPKFAISPRQFVAAHLERRPAARSGRSPHVRPSPAFLSAAGRLLHFRPATDGNAGGLAARGGICRFSAPGAARDAQQQTDAAKRRISARKARYADARRARSPTHQVQFYLA